MNTQAQGLVCQIEGQFESRHHKASYRSLLSLFLKADGHAVLRASEAKSASALSRFLNHYRWCSRPLLRSMRQAALAQVWEQYPKKPGRRPTLNVIVDLTSIEKSGLFDHLPIAELDGVRGVHLVMVFLFIGELRIPWGFRVWQGKGKTTQTQLAIKLLLSLPPSLKKCFRLRVLADGGFSSAAFLTKLHALGFEAVTGMRKDRTLSDERKLYELKRQGEKVRLAGLDIPVWVSWFDVKRKRGKKRYFVISLSKATPRTIRRWGKFRWRIEAFFKTMKQRFSLTRFGQATRLGVYRYLLLSFLAYLIAHLSALPDKSSWPDWQRIAQSLRLSLFPDLILLDLSNRLEQLNPFLTQPLAIAQKV